MMLKQSAIADAVEVVTSSSFYQPAHGHIFNAIITLYAAAQAVDPVTVAEELRRSNLLDAVGGPAALLQIQAKTPAVSNASYYAKIIDEAALLRQLVATATDIAELGYRPLDDISKTLDVAESMIYDVAQRRVTDSMMELDPLLHAAMDHLEALYERKDSITGTPTGFHEIDQLTAGLQPNALVIIGARPAMGKTSLALNMAANAAIRARRPVLYFSLEMGHLELTQRLLGSEGRIDATRIRNGQLTSTDWDKINRTITRLSEAPLWIDDNPNLTVMEIRAKARRLKSRVGDLGLIVVDYLQLMSGRSNAENRQVEISEISRGLKILARELECPVLALSQLSRQLELRSDKRPMLADLRESGSIEQDADVVMFVYRDEIYNKDSPDKGTAEVIVSKHRSGPTGMCRLVFLDYCTHFANAARATEE